MHGALRAHFGDGGLKKRKVESSRVYAYPNDVTDSRRAYQQVVFFHWNYHFGKPDLALLFELGD
mgnify:CR=1 FL=1